MNVKSKKGFKETLKYNENKFSYIDLFCHLNPLRDKARQSNMF